MTTLKSMEARLQAQSALHFLPYIGPEYGVAAPRIAMLGEAAPLPVLAQQLIDAAKAAGGRDNVSVILIHVEQAIKKSGIVGKWWKK